MRRWCRTGERGGAAVRLPTMGGVVADGTFRLSVPSSLKAPSPAREKSRAPGQPQQGVPDVRARPHAWGESRVTIAVSFLRRSPGAAEPDNVGHTQGVFHRCQCGMAATPSAVTSGATATVAKGIAGAPCSHLRARARRYSNSAPRDSTQVQPHQWDAENARRVVSVERVAIQP